MKTTYSILLIFFVSASVFAQRLDKEKIKALKIAHITEQLNLTENEAQKFWPIYNTNEALEDQLRKQSTARRKEKNQEDLSETEAKSLLLDMVQLENDKQELQSKLVNDLLKVLPATKIIKLMQVERSFRRKLIEEYKERHSRRD
ncbi:hypothetical protein ESY86_03135 [Subsaximicrobium wynnwilliamsii]|jgi:hypothetical protein|uniref:Sensor of ECF-type sigma factor n=1 Tax=Subsaximicrobium wynnwilliamsii TaxID=291179 RepID=A0A5C6ZL43_9FLAO|nr:hypothetical protein [Subsaximicrobium wynnwilliamsii]TXD84705.1 hypothetical protein ESY87_02915 [Subsaximicrobium wynnwilliamsii]TXD90375.1 hypothetical protein ESY86_03135 [Subsaximicrobium wynnwilliamsii]TXE04851.1 hypothetical protein ESY88_01445 [Subsaximicrobium wynnwilliamsii]